MNTGRGSSLIKIYGQNNLQYTRRPKLNHLKKRYEQRLIVPLVFTYPLHEILPIHGLSLRFIYIYAIGAANYKKIIAIKVAK